MLFNEFVFPSDLVADIRRFNPWWENKPLSDLPLTKRHLVGSMRGRLDKNLAPIVVVRGPRQVGKTTAQLQLIDEFLKEGIDPKRILRVQFDDIPSLISIADKGPILRIVDWYEKNILGESLNEAARRKRKPYLFLDEVQNLEKWGEQLKSLVDNSTVSVVVTGSSALRIEMGRDSLAGRITTIESGVLSLTEIGKFFDLHLGNPFLADNGLDALTKKDFWMSLWEHGISIKESRDVAFSKFSERGGYPLSHKNPDVAWPNIADQLNETIIRRVIQHDLRLGEKGRKRDAMLLEELFRMACRYTGQSPSLLMLAGEAQRVLNANIGAQRVNHYLRFLSNTLLIRLIEPMEIRLKKKKGPPKICLIDHALRASWLQEVIPLDPAMLIQYPHLSVMAGRIADSVVGAAFSTISGLDISYFPERGIEPEVDFVLTIGVKRIPVEVKYQRQIDPYSDTANLRAFIEKSANNAIFGVLVTQMDETTVDDPRIITIPLNSLLLLR